MTRRSDPFHLPTAAHPADAVGFSYRDTRARARSRLYRNRAASAASAANEPAAAELKSEIRGSLTRHLPYLAAADSRIAMACEFRPRPTRFRVRREHEDTNVNRGTGPPTAASDEQSGWRRRSWQFPAAILTTTALKMRK